jgi:hypothetical protein
MKTPGSHPLLFNYHFVQRARRSEVAKPTLVAAPAVYIQVRIQLIINFQSVTAPAVLSVLHASVCCLSGMCPARAAHAGIVYAADEQLNFKSTNATWFDLDSQTPWQQMHRGRAAPQRTQAKLARSNVAALNLNPNPKTKP